jgi:hypothetical protein
MMQAKHLMIASLIVTVIVYWAGLDGPFLLDDLANLGPVQQWAHGRASWHEAVFGNYSGALGRPVSMASFLLTAGPLGNDPFTFKLGNLLTHLACGWLVWQVTRRVLALDSRLSAHADMVAVAIASVWLLHPLHASTVLYAVQRMAQLSTLFTLGSILVYLDARQQLSSGNSKAAVLKLFFWFPALLVAGLLSKENAAVAPGLCAVFEVAYYRRDERNKRILGAFYALFLAIPALLAAIVFALFPERPLGGYAVLDFGPTERLLTQSRVLMDYIGQLLFPRSAEMGLYTDDFRASTGLFSPHTTALSICALAAATGVAIALRKRWPSLFAGWLFFLVSHCIESTILPLELYYEHRNYLPSIGLFLAVISTVAIAAQAKPRMTRHATTIATLALALTLGAITWGRATVWQDKDAIVDLALEHHPESLRANQTKAMRELNAGMTDESIAILSRIASGDRPRHRFQAKIDLASVNCFTARGATIDHLQKALADAQSKITVGEVQAFNVLFQSNRSGGCAPLTDAAIAAAMEQQLRMAASQPETSLPKQQFRFLTAIVHGRAKQWPSATHQAAIAWRAGGSTQTGMFLAEAYAKAGDLSAATKTLDAAQRTLRSSDVAARKQADRARKTIDQMRASAPDS